MWFVWLGIALALLVVGGLYFRRRVISSVEALGASRRLQRRLGLLLLWLLFAYPVMVFLFIAISLVSGSERMGEPEYGPITWLLNYPFFLSVLVLAQSLPYLAAFDLTRWWVNWRWPRFAKQRWHAFAVLGVVSVFAIYTPVRIIAEHQDIRWRYYRVSRTTVASHLPPFRVAFLSDLQQDAHTSARRIATLVDEVNARTPDLVLSAGDWINVGASHISAAADSASRLRSQHGTYSVVGDHEHFAYFDRRRSVAAVRDALSAVGVQTLDNQVRWFSHYTKRIAVVFVTNSYPAKAPLKQVAALIESVHAADFAILLVHQFTPAMHELVRDRIDLVLAGHTHGGQVNPLLGLWHVSLARVETPFVDGMYSLGRTRVLVTAGVGYSIVPFRYASPGSIETIDISL